MKNVVFLDRGSLDAALRPFDFGNSYVEHDATDTAEEVVARLKGAHIAIVNKVKLNADILSQLPDLKLIAVAATGTNVIDLSYARERGIIVSNIRDYARNTVPEHVIALMFALRRSILPYAQSVKDGAWNRSKQFCYFDYPINDIAGSTMGIVGYGALGRSVAQRAEALGMKVLAYGRTPGDGLVDLETLLTTSDVISLHVPLTPQTANLIGAEQLAMMKKSAILINTARGGLVDEKALVAALKEGRIAGAGIDVVEQEPPRNGNVLFAPDIPNLIVTPHVAWASQQAMRALADQLVDNIEAFVRGQPRNVVA